MDKPAARFPFTYYPAGNGRKIVIEAHEMAFLTHTAESEFTVTPTGDRCCQLPNVVMSSTPHLHYGLCVANPGFNAEKVAQNYRGQFCVRPAADRGAKPFIAVRVLDVTIERVSRTGNMALCGLLLAYDHSLDRPEQISSLVLGMAPGVDLGDIIDKREGVLFALSEEKGFPSSMLTSAAWKEFIIREKLEWEVVRVHACAV